MSSTSSRYNGASVVEQSVTSDESTTVVESSWPSMMNDGGICSLKHQLGEALLLARQHAEVVRSLEMEVSELRSCKVGLEASVQELKDENDELVNDMLDSSHENETLRHRLEGTIRLVRSVKSKYCRVRREKERLEEELEAAENMVENTKDLMKQRVQELSNKCQLLSKEKQTLREQMEGVGNGGISVERSSREMGERVYSSLQQIAPVDGCEKEMDVSTTKDSGGVEVLLNVEPFNKNRFGAKQLSQSKSKSTGRQHNGEVGTFGTSNEHETHEHEKKTVPEVTCTKDIARCCRDEMHPLSPRKEHLQCKGLPKKPVKAVALTNREEVTRQDLMARQKEMSIRVALARRRPKTLSDLPRLKGSQKLEHLVKEPAFPTVESVKWSEATSKTEDLKARRKELIRQASLMSFQIERKKTLKEIVAMASSSSRMFSRHSDDDDEPLTTHSLDSDLSDEYWRRRPSQNLLVDFDDLTMNI